MDDEFPDLSFFAFHVIFFVGFLTLFFYILHFRLPFSLSRSELFFVSSFLLGFQEESFYTIVEFIIVWSTKTIRCTTLNVSL